jgi:uncharacterized protein YqeY
MKQKLQTALKDAMRARAQVKLDTIRALMSAIDYEEEQKGGELDEATSTEIVKRELKKRKEEMEYAEKAARTDQIASLKEEMAILEGFLPQQMSDLELETLITSMKTATPELNMGGLMKLLKEQHAGLYDAKKASELAKRIGG